MLRSGMQLKRGLPHDYFNVNEELTNPRRKIEIQPTV
jgi:hypothetical protein